MISPPLSPKKTSFTCHGWLDDRRESVAFGLLNLLEVQFHLLHHLRVPLGLINHGVDEYSFPAEKNSKLHEHGLLFTY
jgi:hypothetical protein